METIQLISLLRRWFWLLILGLVVGLLAGFFVSRTQKPIYQATTQILVSREAQAEIPSFAGMNAQQLTLTYVQILKTKHLRESTSKRIGADIDDDQLNVTQVPDTQIIEITVEDHDPERAALIANTMVLVLIEENVATQAGQFSASEASLTKQIAQLDEQMNSLQSDYHQLYKQDYETQLSQVNEQLSAIHVELSKLQTEIGEIPNPTTVEGRAQVAAKEIRITQLQSSFKTYDDLRANLIVLGRPLQTVQINEDPRLQQMKTTINLYQQLYLNLISSLESTRLARLKQTPNIVQIEEAYAPENPVRPRTLLYTLISGMVGFVLAFVGIFFLETWKEGMSQPKSLLASPERGEA